MKLCIDYLHEIQQVKGWTPNRISKELGLTSQRMYQLFNEGGTYNDETALKVAEILGVKKEIVLAAAHAERAKSPELKAFWNNLVEKFSHSFECLISCTTPRRRTFSA